jgi:hypothetical protein
MVWFLMQQRETLLLGGFAKFRKATIGFLLSVWPSACPRGKTRLTLDGFSWNFIFDVFLKSVEVIQISLKSDQNNVRVLLWRPIYIFDNTLHIYSYNKKIFRQKLQRKLKHILFWINFIQISCRLWDNCIFMSYCMFMYLLYVMYSLYVYVSS